MSKNRHNPHLEIILLLACVFTFGVYPDASPQAQNVSWQLSQIRERLTGAISEKKPDWKHSPITPMRGSENTVIDQWSREKLVVKVSVVEYPSEAEATEVLRRLASEGGAKVKPQHFGDGGYTWNERGSIAFREGRFLVYVGAASAKIDDPSVLTDVGGEAKATKEFTKYIADAIADSK